MNGIIYDGKKSTSFGIYVSGDATFNAPERDVETKEVPGRNGTLTYDKKRYKNINVKYDAFVRNDFKRNVAAVREWLLSGSAGYKRLEDSYHREYYRMARFAGPLDFDMRFLNLSGECELLFDCMPQRFLKSGDIGKEIYGSAIVKNPTPFEAKPMIRVFGTSGSLLVNNTIVRITAIDEYVDIDCDIQEEYKVIENKNGTVTNIFPVLKSGKNIVSFEGGINKIILYPRWWTI